MKSNEVDLHIHSYYSDGVLTPKEILEEALKKRLKVISIADHNILKGTQELINIQSQYQEIQIIPGVEIDVLEGEINYHILAYGFDIQNTGFSKFISYVFDIKESININLIRILEKKYPNIVSLQEYLNYDYNRSEGYWKALHYFRYKGLIENLKDGKNFYTEYGPFDTEGMLPSIQETCRQIHESGGVAILAHPGKVLKSYTLEEFEIEVRIIIGKGIDGIECYYPSHSEEIVNKCIEICNSENLQITAGSDFHRNNGKRIIGCNNSKLGIINFNAIEQEEY